MTKYFSNFTHKLHNVMDKLFLLDAYALIYRSYYAFIKNPRINSKGLNTSAIVGFVNTLQEVLTKEQPTHIGVALRLSAKLLQRIFARLYPSSKTC